MYFCGRWTSCKFKIISCLEEHCHRRALIFLIAKDLYGTHNWSENLSTHSLEYSKRISFSFFSFHIPRKVQFLNHVQLQISPYFFISFLSFIFFLLQQLKLTWLLWSVMCLKWGMVGHLFLLRWVENGDRLFFVAIMSHLHICFALFRV